MLHGPNIKTLCTVLCKLHSSFLSVELAAVNRQLLTSSRIIGILFFEGAVIICVFSNSLSTKATGIFHFLFLSTFFRLVSCFKTVRQHNLIQLPIVTLFPQLFLFNFYECKIISVRGFVRFCCLTKRKPLANTIRKTHKFSLIFHLRGRYLVGTCCFGSQQKRESNAKGFFCQNQ